MLSVIFDKFKKDMTISLKSNNYGKSKVRVLKVKKRDNVHEIIEFSIDVQFKGDFDDVHFKGDNNKVLPTDTIKNTIYVLAKENDLNSIEEFCIYVGEYFLKNNSQISKVKINCEEKIWKRIKFDDNNNQKKQHNHSFISCGNEVRTCSLKITENKRKLLSGIKDLLVLKTTESAFEGYIKDKFTTLQETNDRIFSTSIKAEWKYNEVNTDYNQIYNKVRQLLLKTFSEHKSLSVQQTLFECGKNITENIREIKEISLSMPNKHYLKFNLEQFGIENSNEIFIPTDEPFGLIEGVIRN